MLGEHRDDHSRVFRALAFMNGRRVRGHQHVELSKSVSDGSALEDRNDLTRSGIDVVDGADIAVVDLLVVVVLDLHHLIAGRKVQPNRSTLRSPAGLSVACSSMFNDRATAPPRFIGHSTWMSWMGSRPNRLGMRAFTNAMMRPTAVSGSSACTK